MVDLRLTDKDIKVAKEEIVEKTQNLLKTDLVKVILYGSCARGDYKADSDVDIALLTKCDRESAKKYNRALADIATDFAMKYYQVVNFVCLPYDEFQEKKDWYPYFRNIDREGQVLFEENVGYSSTLGFKKLNDASIV